MMLGAYFRIQVKNTSGATSGAVTVKGKRWKPSSTDGSYEAESTEQTFLNAASIASGGFANGTAFDNTATGTGYYGASLSVSITGGTAAGDYEVWLQHSTDAGVTWPADGEGILLGVFNVAASTTKIFDITF